MSNASRIPGKRGKRPARHIPELLLHNFARVFKVATPPPSGDVTNGIADWGMLGNDTYGDCGPAATTHIAMAQGRLAAPTDAEVIANYFAYGAAQGEGTNADQGVENASWLSWLYTSKTAIIGTDDDEWAYAEIDVTSPGAADRVHQAMLDFGGVLVGVNLTDDAEQLFSAGQPWTTANGESPDANMGHDIMLAKYDPTGDVFVTWGAEQPSTIDWDAACIDEAWVVVTRDQAEAAGYDFDALTAALDALHGTGSAPAPVSPAPAPAPTIPPPAPPNAPQGPTGAPESLLEAAHRLIHRAEQIAEEAYEIASSARTVSDLTNVAQVISTIAGLAHYFSTYDPDEQETT